MPLKKIILNVFIVIVVLFILDFAVGKVLRHFYFNESSGLHYRTTYLMEKTNAEVLVFGSSEALHHYVPEVFEKGLNMTFYNGGSDGSSILNHTAVLKSVLKRYTPKIIILDYAGSFEMNQSDYDRMSTALMPYYKTHPEIRSIVEQKGSYEKIKLLSEVYPFNSQVLTIAIGNLEVNKTRKGDNQGYVAVEGEWKAIIDSIGISKAYPVDSNKIDAIKEFLTLAKNAGSKVIVVYSPIFRKFNNRQEIDICNQICLPLYITVMDFTKDTLFLNQNQLFRDIEHLNNTGAVVFSQKVVDKIKIK